MLKIPNSAVAPAQMLPEIHDKGKRQVNDYGRAEGEKRGIDKEQPDAGGSQAQFLAKPGANPKGPLLKKFLNLVHHNNPGL